MLGFPDGPYYLDANGTDGINPSRVDRVYKDGLRIASNDTKAIAALEAKELAKELRREELVALVRKFTDGTSISVPAEEMRDPVRALAELVGVDVKVKKDK